MPNGASSDTVLSEKALLYAYDIYADGRSEKLGANELSLKAKAGAAYRWIHLDLADSAVASWLTQQLGEVVAGSLTLQDTRPRCVRHDDGILLNLRGVNLNPDADPEDMVSVRLWISEKLIISVRIRRLLAVVNLRERVEADDAPKAMSSFLSFLTEGLTEKMNPVIMGMADHVDDLETESLENPRGLRTELAGLRRKTIILRRYIAPQRDALGALAALGGDLIDGEARSSLRETVDRVTRMVEDLDAIRERCAILNDQLSAQRAEETNDRLMVLSIVAAVFLPLGFFTGLLGVNIGGIPGAQAPWAFPVFCLGLSVIGAALVWWFRMRKWL